MIEVTLRPCIHHVPALRNVKVNVGFARAVLEDLVDGRTWVDRPTAPRAGHTLHPHGMGLVWGDDIGEIIGPLATHLRTGAYRARDEWLQIDPRWEHLDWDGLLHAESSSKSPECEGATVQRFNRVNFHFDRATFLSRHGNRQAPVGCQLQPMSAREFDIPGVSVVPSAFWRDSQHFLANGGGWCIDQDGVPAAIAFSSFRFDSELEIGVETHPAHRGKGFAVAAAVAMIHAVLAAGLTPVWSCRQENAASLRLALRLGFVVSRVGPYFRLPTRQSIATRL